MKRIVGIASVNTENLVGSIYTAIVVVDSSFQREFPKVESFFNPQWILLAKKKILRFEVARITPNHMHYGVPLLLSEQYGTLINTVDKFWQDTEIYHNGEGIIPRLPVQVRKKENVTGEIANYSKDNHIIRVARQFAMMSLFKECIEIKNTYGDFGKGTADDPVTVKWVQDNPTNIWVRKDAKRTV